MKNCQTMMLQSKLFSYIQLDVTSKLILCYSMCSLSLPKRSDRIIMPWHFFFYSNIGESPLAKFSTWRDRVKWSKSLVKLRLEGQALTWLNKSLYPPLIGNLRILVCWCMLKILNFCLFNKHVTLSYTHELKIEVCVILKNLQLSTKILVY